MVTMEAVEQKKKKPGQLDALTVESVRQYLTTHPALMPCQKAEKWVCEKKTSEEEGATLAKEERIAKSPCKGKFGRCPHKDASRAYEQAIVKLIDNNDWEEETVKRVMEELIQENIARDPDLAYSAFYALCTYYRRNKIVGKYTRLIDAWQEEFKSYASYAFLKLMCDKMVNPHDWELLETAKTLCGEPGLSDNYGVKHCYAEYVADACEADTGRMKHFVETYLQDAKDKLEEAIHADPEYAKFYVTRGRLTNVKAVYEINKDFFSEALADIDRALKYETKTEKRAEYRVIATQLKNEFYEKQLLAEIEAQEQDVKKQFQENNVKNLEFLSFFSAIIGLLIAGTQTVLNMTFPQAAAVLIVLAGCLLTAFGALGYILHGNDEVHGKINKKIVIIGIVLLALAIVVGTIYALFVPKVQ